MMENPRKDRKPSPKGLLVRPKVKQISQNIKKRRKDLRNPRNQSKKPLKNLKQKQVNMFLHKKKAKSPAARKPSKRASARLQGTAVDGARRLCVAQLASKSKKVGFIGFFIGFYQFLMGVYGVSSVFFLVLRTSGVFFCLSKRPLFFFSLFLGFLSRSKMKARKPAPRLSKT